jgi:DNA-binding ferritin-like protein
METAFIDALTAQYNLAGAAQLAHWNSVGENFYEYHLLFMRIYETVEAKIDTLAEQARGKGTEIPAKIFNSVPEIEWDDCVDLAKEILKLVDDLCDALNDLHEECDKKNEYGILNVVEDIMSDCNTMKYLLGSVVNKI